MNGINSNTILNNTNLYSNKPINNDAAKSAANNATAEHDAYEQSVLEEIFRRTHVHTYQDTYEHTAPTKKAGYDRPKSIESKYLPLDANGIQEGITLSDKASKLLENLREKYKNLDIAVAQWCNDEEQNYYAKRTNKISVLINPELLEKMAADESVRGQYEDVLANAGESIETLTNELGADADKVKNFSITMDADGKVKYAVQLIKDMTEKNKVSASDKQKERIEEKRAEKKEKEKLETEKIEADSIENLIKAIKEKLNPAQQTEKITIKEDDVTATAAMAAGVTGQ